MTDKKIDIQEVKNELNAISPAFCLAKWSQVTVHLHNGTTHSCHHPTAHRIPLDEIEKNPAALHNTSFKLKQREAMLGGVRPQECDYCWRIEDAPGNNISDRILKSSYSWSYPHQKDILANPLDPNFKPRYVEVNLGDICNFKCSYCTPDVSTRWMAEIKQHGPYPTSQARRELSPESPPIAEGQVNPYMEAWWKWWPDLYPHLHTFRVTGGEPLLNKSFYKTLDWMQEHPNPNLIFGINTNLCPPQDLWDKFIEQLKVVSSNNSVKRVEVYTSAEAWGSQAEYIRHGMNFQMWIDRLWQILETLPAVSVTIMATYNALSVTSFDRLIAEALRIKQSESLYNEKRPVPLFLDISYLRHPAYQSLKVLPPEFRPLVIAHADLMTRQPETHLGGDRYQRGFLPFEAEKMERIKNWFLFDQDESDEANRKLRDRQDFYHFFAEHDRRRQTNFLEVFPELKDFWQMCAELESSPLALKS